jgi:hypothetical protein
VGGEPLVWSLGRLDVSPGHQDRQPCLAKHRARDSSKHALGQSRVAISAHDDGIGPEGFGLGKEKATDVLAI